MAVAGLLGRAFRRPVVTMADEIYSGSYRGDRSERWKRLCRFGMRASALTVVNTPERASLQRECAGLSNGARMTVYPGCFRSPPELGDRAEIRRERGIPLDATVISYSGVMNLGNGGVWLAEILRAVPNAWVWGQIVNLDPLVKGLMTRLQGAERLVLEPTRLGWRESWSVQAASDIGLVFYLQDAPQFRHMGSASNRLCMFLSMGVPVIATRQDSFSFIEEFRCGLLIDSEADLPRAIRTVEGDLEGFRQRARECARLHIDAAAAYERLKNELAAIARA